jgi:hypothetical protein
MSEDVTRMLAGSCEEYAGNEHFREACKYKQERFAKAVKERQDTPQEIVCAKTHAGNIASKPSNRSFHGQHMTGDGNYKTYV